MGHERTGMLPRSRRWQEIVAQIGASSATSFNVEHIARETIHLVRQRFLAMHESAFICEAFRFLVDLALSASEPERLSAFVQQPVDRMTPLRVAQAMQARTQPARDLPEYDALTERAAIQALSEWYESHRPPQNDLFGDAASPLDVWRHASNGAGFCELSRLFFSHVVEYYLNYFLEREASAALGTVYAREQFAGRTDALVDWISRDAFETSKITQSYAAGWFNKREGRRPSDVELRAFLNRQFGKLCEELRREGEAE